MQHLYETQTTDECYDACAHYLMENLQDRATDYSLSKSLELLRDGDTDGARFWVNIYLAIVKVADTHPTLACVTIH
jgi:hypothetical protein